MPVSPQFDSARRQLFAVVNNTETFAAVNAANFIKAGPDTKLTFPTTPTQRSFISGSRGARQNAAGLQRAQLNTSLDICGFGMAVGLPAWMRLLRGCGFGYSLENGTASLGTMVPDVRNGIPATPVLSGTYSGDRSGRLEVLITASEPTEVTFQTTFYPAFGGTDGTLPVSGSFTQDDGSAVSIDAVLAGVSIDFPNDVGFNQAFHVGAKFTGRIVSASAARAVMTPVDEELEPGDADAAGKVPFLQFGLIEVPRLRRMALARGNATLAFPVGQVPRATYDFMGIGEATSTGDTDIASVTPDAVIAPTVRGCTATFGGTTLRFANLTISTGNQVAMPTDATSASGYGPAKLGMRRIVATIDPLALAPGQLDLLAAARQAQTGSIDVIVGNTAGNRVRVTGTGQVETFDSAEREGKITDPLNLLFYVPEDDGPGAYELQIEAY